MSRLTLWPTFEPKRSYRVLTLDKRACSATGKSVASVRVTTMHTWRSNKRGRCRALALGLLLAPLLIQACPKDCSQHGLCSGPGENGYCLCEPGFTGNACDIRLCPKGDDPLTTGQNSREVLFGIDSLTGDVDGVVGFVFLGERVLLPAKAELLTDDTCSHLLSSLASIGHATCRRISPISIAGGANYSVTLDSFPTSPYENNIYPNDGNPSLSAFQCETDRVSTGQEDGAVVCYLEDRVTTDIKEYAECANHGLCDRITGRCQCELGFHGPACDDISDAQDVSSLRADGPFYTGTVLRLQAAKAPSGDFNMLRAHAAGQDLLTLDGKGDLTVHRGTLRVEEGGTLVEGGVVIGSGGLGIEEDGMDVASSSGGSVGVLSSLSQDFHGSVLTLRSVTPARDGYHFLRAMAGNGTRVFEVKGDGHTSIQGGVEVASGGLVVSRGQAFLGDGAIVQRNLEVRGAAVVSEGLQVGGVVKEGTALLKVHATTEGGEGRLMEARVGEEVVYGLAASGRVTIARGGIEVRGGGVVVEAGGQDIKSGGLRVDGGIEVRSGGLTLSDDEGFKIRNGGLKVTDKHDTSAALSAQSLSPAFGGSVLELSVPNTALPTATGSQYNFLQCKGSGGQPAFSVEADGSVRSTGGLQAPGFSKLGEVEIGSRAALGKTVVMAGERIEVDTWTGTSFVEIGDDGVEARNELVLDKEGAKTGQLLFVKNGDAQATVGMIVPPGATYLFLFDGVQWGYLGVQEAGTVALQGVRRLTAAANLDIGDFSLAARSLIVSSQPPGRLAFYGPAGLLSGSDDLSLSSDGVLKVKRLAVEEMSGPLDLKGNSLRNAVIEHATLSGLASVKADRLFLADAPMGAVAVAGPKGEVSFPKGLSYDVSKGVLSVGRLRVEALELEGGKGLSLPDVKMDVLQGDVQCQGAVLMGPTIEGGRVRGVDSIATQSLKLTGLSSSRGSLLTIGSQEGDVTASGEGLQYDATTQTLILARLEVGEIKDLDQMIRGDLLADQTLHNVTIAGGRLEGITFLGVDSIDIKGRAAIDGETFIAGSLTVEGTVMGSGPYVDTSDGRLKENVVDIVDALQIIQQMRGVRYRFHEKARLRRRLETGPQIGFIAQEVESVAPELVHTDSGGYKYVAYSKAVPFLVEGIKQLWGMVRQMQDEAKRKATTVSALWDGLAGMEERLRAEGDRERDAAPLAMGGDAVRMLAARVAQLEQEKEVLAAQVQAQEGRLQRLEAALTQGGKA